MREISEPQNKADHNLGSKKLTEVADKCPRCKAILFKRELSNNFKTCPHCNYHFRLTAYERIALLVDPHTFVEVDANIIAADPLNFKSYTQTYQEKLEKEREKVGLNSSVVTGYATIETFPVSLAVMDFRFIGGSMGAAVGEKITRAFELGIEGVMPVLVISASGGARMQEGIFSLMQMVKTTAALAKLGEKGIPFFSLMTDPTTGGVTASFAMLGDVILSEPGSLICFAGPRVIEQFMHVTLPTGAVTAEFALHHGQIDMIVHRKNLRDSIAQLLYLYSTHRTS
jgi:acetyl-CoA carboxylase carboxyl transferase subunit beta